MKVLVTGANGFIGKNLCATLDRFEEYELLRATHETTDDELATFLVECDFIFHLAGVNRPKDEEEFFEGNSDYTLKLTNGLMGRKVPIIFTSSTQVERDNSYGQSKKLAERTLSKYGQNTGAPVYIYRLTNIYGKWSRPNYNTVVATFCYNISRNLPIQVNNQDLDLNLCYIDDVIEEFLKALNGNPTMKEGYCIVPVTNGIKIGQLAATIQSFKESRTNLSIGDMSDQLEKNLYSTYLSFLPKDLFSYPLKMNIDDRGSFTEILRTAERGQFSVNISKPGITKGNHWHHSKNEKFLVVSGSGVIRFRKVNEEEIIEYYVNSEKLEVVDIPVGYTHNIENIGNTDMVTFMWVNECFNPDKPDTYFEEV
ncbi:NAD-dependent epimerase/dehydratase family protein [Paenibacillus sp. 2TAB23]|uniref:polysaccharide biosynthesis C-terminal domain-containing protein n=1 Tax=Paenibacillus sp. 2TAB23 TaxID=3233004 RepID=UPI003F98E553